jgi:hypothetical protein
LALTELQTLIVWALLSKPGGGSLQKDIRPEVKRPDREALITTGLITTEKRGRNLWLEVTDKGWSWAADHLDADLPQRSTAGSVVLQGWLTRLKAFMQLRGLVLADILAPQPPSRPEQRPLDYPAVRERIRKAYLDVTGGQLNTRALLSDIRDRVKDIDRSSVDSALKRMHLEEGITLSGLNNPQEITPAIREAELSFKGQPMYVLWITR